MPKTKEALLAEAKELGINVEGLDYNALRSTLKKAREANDTSNTTSDQKSEEASTDNSSVEANSGTDVNPTVQRHLEAKALRKKNAAKAKKADKKAKAKEAQAKSELEKGKSKKDNRPVYTDDRGLKYLFKTTAPKTLNIDGVSRKVSEIIKDDETMLELVYGNSNFIEQIY